MIATRTPRLTSTSSQPVVRNGVAFLGGDNELLAGLRERNPAARAALFERYAPDVQSILYRLLGPDPELQDILHDVFLSAFRTAHTIIEAATLREWLRSVAVFSVRDCLRRRRRRRWLTFRDPEELPERTTRELAPELRQLLQAVHRTLGAMKPDDAIVFALRYVQRESITEQAKLLRVSTSTIKRRIARAEASFERRAATDPVLADWGLALREPRENDL